MNTPLAETIGANAERLVRRMSRGAARVVLAGGPRTGKSTLASAVSSIWEGRVFHTDDLLESCDFLASAAEVARWMNETPGPWIVEGVAAVRGLRKYLDANAGTKPCDLVLWMNRAVVLRTPKQEALAKGCATVWNGSDSRSSVVMRLLDRGVMIEDD